MSKTFSNHIPIDKWRIKPLDNDNLIKRNRKQSTLHTIFSLFEGSTRQRPSPLFWRTAPCMEHVLPFIFECNHAEVCAAFASRYLYSIHKASHNELARTTKSPSECFALKWIRRKWPELDCLNSDSVLCPSGELYLTSRNMVAHMC